MKRMNVWMTGFAALGLALMVNSCKSVQDTKDNIASAQDFATAETEFAGAFDITDDLNESDGKIKKGASTVLPGGVILSWVDSSFTDGNGIEYVLDFGSVGTSAPYGLLCGDGKYRAGKLRVKVSNRYLLVGSVVQIIASDAENGTPYYSGDALNMFKLEGKITVTRTADQQLTVGVEGGKVAKDITAGGVTGTFASFQGNKVITRTKGTGTPGIWGDEYEVTGNGSGTNTEGDDYTWKITTPLVKKMELGCAKTFVKGVIEIQNTTANSSIKVDFDPYSNGACDKVVKAIIGGKEYTFTVK